MGLNVWAYVIGGFVVGFIAVSVVLRKVLK